MADDNRQEQAQAPYKADFARLGRSVWFTLESSIRADEQRAASLEERLEQVGEQVQQTALMGISWMRLGNWKTRQAWNDNEWVAFLRLFPRYSQFVFEKDSSTQEEIYLCDAFGSYWNFFASLPERPDDAPEDATMESVGRAVDARLETFQERLGDPLTPCACCGKCALGYKLFRCSRCKRVQYCSRACQSKAWKRGHKQECEAVVQDEDENGKDAAS